VQVINEATGSRTVLVTNAHRDDGKRFFVRANEKLTAFMELEAACAKLKLMVSKMSQSSLDLPSER
jgi:hypothetical protein